MNSSAFGAKAIVGTGILLASLAGCDGTDFDVSQQIGPDPVLPEPTSELMPDMKVAEVAGWKDDQTPSVPDSLVITAYAKDLVNPRTVHTLPNGDVLVVQSREPSGKPIERPKDMIRGWIMSMAHGDGGGAEKESNLVTLLRDTNRDGKVDERHDLLTGLHSPFGVAWRDGTLYVAAADAVLAYSYQLGQAEITAEPQVLTPLPGGPINHHWTKDLALSPDGRYLYASVGSNSNVAERGLEAEKGRAAIWQIDRQTGAARVFASGLRNPNGLAFHPETGVLWTVVNERDELGPNLVPDFMTSVQEGAFYGWPWSYYGAHVDERVYPPRPDLVEKAVAPDYALSSHVAALGLIFSNGSALPEPFANGAFIGEHGSWNRNTFNGYKVVYVPFENGRPAGKAQDVVTGFLEGDQARGRPVGVAIDGTGALLIADDAGNTVWRVAGADGRVTPNPVGTDGQIGAAVTSEAAPPTGPEGAASGGSAPPAASATPPEPPQTEVAPAVLPRTADEGASPRQP
ncbi:PQQ-dependent sugar dehydrogenase [Sinorhizobium medicae]|uniref:Sorbosone dehydrogenase n=1 Tax=Sinorhizobium medicae TaxID=110321 RepID=A0A508X484_9HYPH|nr:sorbosone dehydrogenase family protein [Sinorhizobium medicae]MBO1941835.1 sorbosone dehydrogenase family protein [Sinorhizobium medicae]MDX0514090.1 sorbosone dehydrogenase family protein [Sinorhizobium medicae]MDX0520774.1 sorbosone dehydrogenase family protein [Sinorhizobium medicae]MDX0549491.1 sorbosone dehydrogenase family protein [Sinorhizobium medicae]MDX0630763.1 sorbosone dehydrogenase family protein [Sinorhizobium medicae]